MNDRDPLNVHDDTDGHKMLADTENAETDDTDGHKMMADAEKDETDDTEGHLRSR
jgi:hypothetical protein